jgi:DNA-binding MarR family transcriptional regulator
VWDTKLGDESAENSPGATLDYVASERKRHTARHNNRKAPLPSKQRELLVWLWTSEQAILNAGTEKQIEALKRDGVPVNPKKYYDTSKLTSSQRSALSRGLRALEDKGLLRRPAGTTGATYSQRIQLTSRGREEAEYAWALATTQGQALVELSEQVKAHEENFVRDVNVLLRRLGGMKAVIETGGWPDPERIRQLDDLIAVGRSLQQEGRELARFRLFNPLFSLSTTGFLLSSAYWYKLRNLRGQVRQHT